MTKLAADKLAELILDIFAQLLDITSSLGGIHETYKEQLDWREVLHDPRHDVGSGGAVLHTLPPPKGTVVPGTLWGTVVPRVEG